MADAIEVIVNGKTVTVAPHSSVAVALTIEGTTCRTSVRGEPRGPLCAMDICFECRATINGVPHRRSCQINCAPGMDIRTQ
jgi:sarcosine oxidase subunit alpha